MDFEMLCRINQDFLDRLCRAPSFKQTLIKTVFAPRGYKRTLIGIYRLVFSCSQYSYIVFRFCTLLRC